MLGHNAQAEALFDEGGRDRSESPDVRVYLGLHYARAAGLGAGRCRCSKRPQPTCRIALPVLEALADLRAAQEDWPDACPPAEDQRACGLPRQTICWRSAISAMEVGQTKVATAAFEGARAIQGAAFTHDLELGVLYLSAHRFADARIALDRVPSSSPDYAMALFKRAQVSVLLREPDAPARIAHGRREADAITRPLIEREKLFARE